MLGKGQDLDQFFTVLQLATIYVHRYEEVMSNCYDDVRTRPCCLLVNMTPIIKLCFDLKGGVKCLKLLVGGYLFGKNV